MSSDTAPFRVRYNDRTGLTYSNGTTVDGWEVTENTENAWQVRAICCDEQTAQLLADALNAQPVTP